MYQDLFEYIQKPKSERQSHLDLKDPCIEIGANSKECRALLAHYIYTTIRPSKKIHLCHACNNAKCSNVKHLYWGTVAENSRDSFNAGRITWNKGLKGYKQNRQSAVLV